ncbi:CHS1 [Acanthosepion pharaonis]|uniref:chitin synthase n=1 Tax=Acanthosepion pharaonis TaxID=158019 RepID=A0A812C6K6_ACAPH|nr:CHS1 [Sepia pharaonis]
MYTTRATEAAQYVQCDQGEDRWLSTLILQQGYRIDYCAAADAMTHAPETFSEFFNQRRRWGPSTLANIVDLLGSWKTTVMVNDNISTLYMLYQFSFLPLVEFSFLPLVEFSFLPLVEFSFLPLVEFSFLPLVEFSFLPLVEFSFLPLVEFSFLSSFLPRVFLSSSCRFSFFLQFSFLPLVSFSFLPLVEFSFLPLVEFFPFFLLFSFLPLESFPFFLLSSFPFFLLSSFFFSSIIA